MPYFFASAVDARISSGVIFFSILSRIVCEPLSTPSDKRWQPARRISLSSSSLRRSTRVSQLQKKPILRARISWHSSRTRFFCVVNVSSLIWIIFTGSRDVTLFIASSTYARLLARKPRPQVVSEPQNVHDHAQPRDVIMMCVSK